VSRTSDKPIKQKAHIMKFWTGHARPSLILGTSWSKNYAQDKRTLFPNIDE